MGKILKIKLSDLTRKGLLSWILAAFLEFVLLPADAKKIDFAANLAQMSIFRMILVVTALIALLLNLNLSPKTERWMILGGFAALCAIGLLYNFSKPFLGGCLVCLVPIAVFTFCGCQKDTAQLSRKKGSAWWLTPVVIVTAAFLAITIAWTSIRVCNFVASTYDFGIFTQMFYNMKTTGLPMTTLERSQMLSHMQVHVSPIFYLMLPFYWIFPKPVTLQVLQSVTLASAVIPLWLIAGKHGLIGFRRAAVCVLLLVFPAFLGGVAFDLHENCFLTPLILWLFYAVDTKNLKWTIIFAALTLLVKEDAAVYVAVIGLWMFFKADGKKERSIALSVMVGALVYFVAVTMYLSHFGQGVMSNRYDNFMYGGSTSLITVVKAVFLSPLKVIYEIFSTKKLEFILQTMLPLAFLPFITRKFGRYILLIPYILVNLMPYYSEQHSIFFQYAFGSTAFLIYLTVINLADIRFKKLHFAAFAVAIVCAVYIFATDILPIPKYIITNYLNSSTPHEQVALALDSIPDDASVTADTYYTPHLAQHRYLYDVDYCTDEQLFGADYVVLQTNRLFSYRRFNTDPALDEGYQNLVKLIEAADYEIFTEVEGVLVIYRRVS